MFPVLAIPPFAVRSPPILAVPVIASVPPEIESPEMFPVLAIPAFAVRSPPIVAVPVVDSVPPDMFPVTITPLFALTNAEKFAPDAFRVPLEVKVCPIGTVSPALALASPEKVDAFLTFRTVKFETPETFKLPPVVILTGFTIVTPFPSTVNTVPDTFFS
jgi:hypothetical protein